MRRIGMILLFTDHNTGGCLVLQQPVLRLSSDSLQLSSRHRTCLVQPPTPVIGPTHALCWGEERVDEQSGPFVAYMHKQRCHTSQAVIDVLGGKGIVEFLKGGVGLPSCKLKCSSAISEVCPSRRRVYLE